MRASCVSFMIVLVVALRNIEGKAHHKVQHKEVKHVQASTKSQTKPDGANMENEAGDAVLRLLDAKIGKKVEDAAAEVQRFLTEALGKHIKETTKNMLAKTKHQPTNYKEHEGKAVLVNFKLPYVVTPVHVKKVKKPKSHHKQLKHASKSKSKPQPLKDTAKHPVTPPVHTHPSNLPYSGAANIHPAPYKPTQPATVPTVDYSATTMTPCQGSCMNPCTSACYAPDCCCCPQTPAPIPPPPPPPVYYSPPPPPPPPPVQIPVQAPPVPVMPPCHPLCSYRCSIFCPKQCCKLSGKRSEIEHVKEEGSGDVEGSGSEHEEVEASVPKEEEEGSMEDESSGDRE